MKPKVYNNTSLTLDEVNALPLIGKTVSNWRQRNIELRQHPSDGTLLVSVGTTFDEKMVVIAIEKRTDWTTALDYIKHGKVYVSQ